MVLIRLLLTTYSLRDRIIKIEGMYMCNDIQSMTSANLVYFMSSMFMHGIQWSPLNYLMCNP